MHITFYAHACFRLEGNGISIITDPYTPSVSRFEPVGETCDVVLMSSATDRFHSDWTQVPGNPRIIDATTIGQEGIEVHGVPIRAFPNRENKVEAAADNAMYLVTLDGVRVLHMGDAGWTPAPKYVKAMAGQVDVLLALTGGLPTIPLDDLDQFIAAIRPRVVIPMHYYHPRGVLNIQPVSDFTARYSADIVRHHDTSIIEFTPATLPSSMQIIVLPQSR
jgi:L-ascorbate metabolism protein UlaG (beta-lactamase superfamily)